MSRSLKDLPRSLNDIPPPPGPFRRSFWRSPIRGPWLTAFFGSILLVGITVLFVTGRLPLGAYTPALRHNSTVRGHPIAHIFLFDWPTHPYWLYRATQGVHVPL